MRNRSVLVLMLLALGAQACVVESEEVIIDEGYEEAVIEWSIEGEIGAGLCDEYAISSWRVVVVGADDEADIDYPCDDTWDTGSDFLGDGALAAGLYDITVEAYDGAELLASVELLDEEVTDLDGASPDVIGVDFPIDPFL